MSKNDSIINLNIRDKQKIIKRYNSKLTQDEFIKRSIENHGNKYDYSAVKYTNTRTKVIIKCLTHDVIFDQVPNNHIMC